MSPPTRDDLDRILDEVCNCGRGGSDYERGALYFLSDEIRQRAFALPQDGTLLSLAHDLALAPTPALPAPAPPHELAAEHERGGAGHSDQADDTRYHRQLPAEARICARGSGAPGVFLSGGETGELAPRAGALLRLVPQRACARPTIAERLFIGGRIRGLGATRQLLALELEAGVDLPQGGLGALARLIRGVQVGFSGGALRVGGLDSVCL